MKLYDFLRDLEAFYPLNESEEKVQKRISSYAEILEGEIVKNHSDYDFAKLLRHIQTHYTYKQFPSIPYILELLPNFKIIPQKDVRDEGTVIVMTLPDGMKYDFVITGYGNSLEYLKEKARKKYGNSIDIKRYPKGTVVIGNTIIQPD